jgi:hypothetical protein
VYADDVRAIVKDLPASNVVGEEHASNRVMSPIETTTQLMYIVHTRSPQEMQDMYYQQQQQQKRGMSVLNACMITTARRSCHQRRGRRREYLAYKYRLAHTVHGDQMDGGCEKMIVTDPSVHTT